MKRPAKRPPKGSARKSIAPSPKPKTKTKTAPKPKAKRFKKKYPKRCSSALDQHAKGCHPARPKCRAMRKVKPNRRACFCGATFFPHRRGWCETGGALRYTSNLCYGTEEARTEHEEAAQRRAEAVERTAIEEGRDRASFDDLCAFFEARADDAMADACFAG